jgi:hypothetical protein
VEDTFPANKGSALKSKKKTRKKLDFSTIVTQDSTSHPAQVSGSS